MSRFDEQPDAGPHEECAFHIHKLQDENAALRKKIDELRAALAAMPGKQEFQHERVLFGARTYGPMLRAAIALLAEVELRHELSPPPLKYGVPYGAINALREAIEKTPQQPPAALMDAAKLALKALESYELVNTLSIPAINALKAAGVTP